MCIHIYGIYLYECILLVRDTTHTHRDPLRFLYAPLQLNLFLFHFFLSWPGLTRIDLYLLCMRGIYVDESVQLWIQIVYKIFVNSKTFLTRFNARLFQGVLKKIFTEFWQNVTRLVQILVCRLYSETVPKCRKFPKETTWDSRQVVHQKSLLPITADTITESFFLRYFTSTICMWFFFNKLTLLWMLTTVIYANIYRYNKYIYVQLYNLFY